MNCYNCGRAIRDGADGLTDHAPGCPLPDLIARALEGDFDERAVAACFPAEDAAQLAARLRRHSALLAIWCGVSPEELIADAGVLMQLVGVRLQQRAGG